ncbi:MAG: FKBP-type peptidyl-prolyl cis-trans isomerase, partial [Chloroflexi bacterium]|nr:FKBP-type peptidyl-prolyl cis-trans isomerase [Chloroflexota bacterium]
MAKAKKGDTVRVHFVGKLSDGSVFDASRGMEDEEDEPIEFIIGNDEVLDDFEKAVIGMEPGDTAHITIPAARAYGEWDDELVYEINRDRLPKNLKPEIGMDLQIKLPDGNSTVMSILDIDGDTIVLDNNHPLAGEDLVF